MDSNTDTQKYIIDLKDYEEIHEINRGTFGRVYLVQNKMTKEKFAAKVILVGPNQSLFSSREIDILIQVHAPTIIRFHGFSDKDLQGYTNATILMEYKDKGSLQELIDKEILSQAPGEYDNTAKQIILCGIAHGMMVLHSNRVIHRDLKPGNILLDSNYHPSITDFGLSKFLDPENSRNQSMAGIGTLPYIAPEVHDGDEYGRKSDVYSFGILMYEVITGEKAFHDLLKKAYGRFLMKVMSGERPQFPGPIKPGLKKLIEDCWSQDPEKRPDFHTIFHKLSLYHVADDAANIDNGSNATTENEEGDKFQYCLDDVDQDRLYDYVESIAPLTKTKEPEHDKKSEPTSNSESTSSKLENPIEGLTPMEMNLKIRGMELTQIEIPSSMTSIANGSFTDCISLTKIIIPSSVLSIGEFAFYRCTSITQITIPSYVTTIEQYTFAGCHSLKQVLIPNSVTSIGKCAFSGCDSLLEMSIPSSVTSIGELAFESCKSLTEIKIPESVISIDDNAFMACSSLKRISIPDSVENFGYSILKDCFNLEATIAQHLKEILGPNIF